MKILIVDDNEQYRKLLAAIFIDRGWEAIDAAEGRRGLELVQEHIPDVILSDIMMPHIDGFQFLYALRSSAFGDIIFIFYTSTYTKASHREFAQSLGADAYITKPLDPEDIVQVLMDILDRKELRPARRPMPGEEEFLRLHSLFLSEKLMEKEAALQREAVEHLKAEKELTRLKERDRLRDASGLGIGLTAQMVPPGQQTTSTIEIADDVYLPVGRIETLCRTLSAAGLPDGEGLRLVEKICSSMHKLRNLIVELQRNLLLPRSAVLAPIRRIQIMIDVLKKDYGGLGAATTPTVEEMEGLLRKFAGSVEDLLRVASVAKQNLKYEQVDMTALVEDLLARLRQSSPHRRARFQVQQGMVVTGDALLLKMAIEQLLDNAWKYTAEREEAVIEAGVKTEAGKKPVFFIRDNGIGFPAEWNKRLFVAFAKGDVRGNLRGNGIGLTLARAIVRRHGGELWGVGEPGRGAIFSFTCCGG